MVKERHLIEQAIHHFARGRQMRERNFHGEDIVGVEGMVDQNARRPAFFHHFRQFVDALECVEVEAENEVGIAYQKSAAHLRLGINHRILDSRQKLQRAWQLVGIHHVGIFSHFAQHPAQRQSATQRITIG